EAFREAFVDFEIETVAGFDGADVSRLLANSAIVRNRAKIDAASANAEATMSLPGEVAALSRPSWSVPPNRRAAPRHGSDIPAALQAELERLETQMQRPSFWDDAEAAARVSAQHASTQRRLETFRSLESDIDDLEELAELAADDPELAQEVESQLASIEQRLG